MQPNGFIECSAICIHTAEAGEWPGSLQQHCTLYKLSHLDISICEFEGLHGVSMGGMLTVGGVMGRKDGCGARP